MAKSRRPAIAVIGALMVAAAAFAAVGQDCYEDLVVTGAGISEVNGVYGFAGMINGKPSYTMGSAGVWYSSAGGRWEISYTLFLCYYHTSDSPTPPSSNWSQTPDSLPVPTLSGGSLCPESVIDITILPTGEAGPGLFLDRGIDLPEGEEAPMIGLQPLAAIYEVGETITGSCQILNSSNLPTGASYVHIYTYSVDVSARPESVVLLDHWMASYNHSTQEFEIAWDTSGLAPGYYDLYLSFADGSSELMRIQLVAAPV